MVILKNAYEEALKIMRENSEALDRISEFLIKKETITGKEFMKIFREVNGIEEEEKVDLEKKETIAEEITEETTEA